METKEINGHPYGICVTCGALFRVSQMTDNLYKAACPSCRRAARVAERDRVARAAYQEELHRATVRITRTVDPETGSIIEWRR